MASVPYRGRPGSPPTRPRGARRSLEEGEGERGHAGGRVGGAGVGGRRDSADDGNNFQRMSWRGKEKKEGRERERETERERRSGYPATEDHTGVPADLSPISTVFRTCTRWLLNADGTVINYRTRVIGIYCCAALAVLLNNIRDLDVHVGVERRSIGYISRLRALLISTGLSCSTFGIPLVKKVSSITSKTRRHFLALSLSLSLSRFCIKTLILSYATGERDAFTSRLFKNVFY